jgi:hypothetical protein
MRRVEFVDSYSPYLRLQFLYAALRPATAASQGPDVLPVLECLGRDLLRHGPDAHGAASQSQI